MGGPDGIAGRRGSHATIASLVACARARPGQSLRFRSLAGLSQRGLAAKLGVSHSFVAKVELGAQRPTLEEFFAWCDATGCDPSVVAADICSEGNGG